MNKMCIGDMIDIQLRQASTNNEHNDDAKHSFVAVLVTRRSNSARNDIFVCLVSRAVFSLFHTKVIFCAQARDPSQAEKVEFEVCAVFLPIMVPAVLLLLVLCTPFI